MFQCQEHIHKDMETGRETWLSKKDFIHPLKWTGNFNWHIFPYLLHKCSEKTVAWIQRNT